MKAVSKLTAKIMCGGEIKKNPTARTLLFTIYGEARSFKLAPNRFDPTKTDVKALGHFEVINATTGEEMASGVLFPPGSLGDMLIAAGEGASFAVRVYAEPSTQSPTGYAFDFESALEQKPDDRLAALRNAVLALPAPKGEAEEHHEAKHGKKK